MYIYNHYDMWSWMGPQIMIIYGNVTKLMQNVMTNNGIRGLQKSRSTDFNL